MLANEKTLLVPLANRAGVRSFLCVDMRQVLRYRRIITLLITEAKGDGKVAKVTL